MANWPSMAQFNNLQEQVQNVAGAAGNLVSFGQLVFSVGVGVPADGGTLTGLSRVELRWQRRSVLPEYISLKTPSGWLVAGEILNASSLFELPGGSFQAASDLYSFADVPANVSAGWGLIALNHLANVEVISGSLVLEFPEPMGFDVHSSPTEQPEGVSMLLHDVNGDVVPGFIDMHIFNLRSHAPPLPVSPSEDSIVQPASQHIIWPVDGPPYLRINRMGAVNGTLALDPHHLVFTQGIPVSGGGAA